MHAELVATYRLQLGKNLTFDAAADLVPYLSDLGISHLYLSPLLKAAEGSEHGYDVADPTRIDDRIGDEAALGRLFRRVKEHGMGIVLDIVPNHLAAVISNQWWRDVLAKGRDSEHAEVFDIEWRPPDSDGSGKVLLPVLEDHPSAVLERGELKVEDDELVYNNTQRLPLSAEGKDMAAKGSGVREILDAQHYRLTRWQLAGDEINYRRFFMVATLVGARVEVPAVFEKTHATLFELLDQGPIDGIRVDHPDGLRDPAGYLRTLRSRIGSRWLVVEKILEPGESLPADWPVEGTTGYDFLERAGGLFIDPGGEKILDDLYTTFTGHRSPYGELVREKKRQVIGEGFDSDLRRLVERLREAAEHLGLAYSRREMRRALAELIAAFPVYRTYRPQDGEFSPQDEAALSHAFSDAKHGAPGIEPGLWNLISRVLSGGVDEFPAARDFVARFQQLTGPVMAKGVEDTTFYCFDRLLALNEVGCDPVRFGVGPDAFHQACIESQRRWPRSMLATSTHDTKRSEDVRARLSLLSESGVAWADEVRKWSAHNEKAWGGRTPDRSAEYHLYQTLIGAWPMATERLLGYMQKACREARTRTSWDLPDLIYEEGVQGFIQNILGEPVFVRMFEEFVQPLVMPGRINSLAQLLVKLTAPGIPDIYQGCEIWDSNLVDPDNRREVDFLQRTGLLGTLAQGEGPPPLDDDGLAKQYVIKRTLQLRKRHSACFGACEPGSYRPLHVTGRKLSHTLGYRRGEDVLVVIPRLVLTLNGDWQDTAMELPKGNWRNAFDGAVYTEGPASLEKLLLKLPVALLERI
ncbi:malto-oligosyltrehalose synthase [Luteolibacter sp. GHJ8]|uniref:Malto-oligosyltrehalose synthase n=1 Tax=Luteolibacter rhizosphaerae TaxID=2989719 RepID=A0ABT3FZE6_9BACT|nr:malto-oligosyltrehalose synthase [Luteolibacter rhizosphaerae]MCW1912964.1 malto-oligosyltrehalose synthase [Luteolibacter rhizosphaerae]